MSIKVVDFFCGCGGTSAGLKQAGMDVVAGIDIDEIALTTYAKNFKNARAINKSIVDLTPEELAKTIGVKKTDKYLFAACAPCQPFSTQNRLKSDQDDRVSLLGEFHRFVLYFKPDYIVIENVPGIQKICDGPFTNFIQFLKKEKYECDYAVKNAMDYGVPQSRKRLVLIATRKGEIKLPDATHGEGKLPYATLHDAISHFPPIKAGECHKEIPNHSTASLSEITLRRLAYTPEGGDRRHWPENLILECHKKHKGHNDVYGRLSWDKPSVTLTTKCVSISNGRFGHPDQNRAISVREAAAIQTFPNNFIFHGTTRQAAKQVGNAVPVLLSEAIGKQILKHYNEIQEKHG